MTILEAWSFGLPVLMTPACNIPEGFEAGAAIEVKPDPDSLAVGLKRLVAMSPDERKAMGARGRELAAARFTWSRAASLMADVYRWILGRGDRPDCVEMP